MTATTRLSLLLAGLAALAGTAAEGATYQYVLDVKDGTDSAFEVGFEAPYPGTLAVAADWDETRILSFRLDGAGETSLVERRSGPSPQRMEVDLAGAAAPGGRKFKLSIRALPGRGFAKGTLTLEIPDAPEIVEERRKAAEPPPPPPPEPDPWTVPATAPQGAAPEVGVLFAAVERYRSLVVGAGFEPLPDACGWRTDLLKRFAAWRADAAAGRRGPAVPEMRYLRRLAATAREVEALRVAKDPILGGPVPEDSLRRRAWEQVRKERIRPIERDLDALSETLHEGFAPGLESEAWLPRLIACLTACERYFEERVRLGEDEASNADLATAQWGSILAAVDALERLGPAPDPAGSPSSTAAGSR